MVIAAVGVQAVDVPAQCLAALQGAQRPAVVVAHAGSVAVAAVNYAAVGVAANVGAVLIGADGDSGLNALPVTTVVSAGAPPVAAVGRDGYHQHSREHDAQCAGKQTALLLEHGDYFLSIPPGAGDNHIIAQATAVFKGSFQRLFKNQADGIPPAPCGGTPL